MGLAPPEFGPAVSALSVRLEAEQVERLAAYVSLLQSRAVPLGLVAQGDADRLWERHIVDSLRAAPFIGDAAAAYDLGSGAGLPGVVLAVALPRCRVTLVESSSRRVGFLELAVERLGLPNADIAAARAETLTGPVDAATARAFAPLERCWKIAVPLLRRGGTLVYFAGRGLRRPHRSAAALRDPEPPASVRTSEGLATGSPLVMMTRG